MDGGRGFGYACVCMYGRIGAPVYGFVGVGCVGVWPYECMHIWMCGSMGVPLYGLWVSRLEMGVRVNSMIICIAYIINIMNIVYVRVSGRVRVSGGVSVRVTVRVGTGFGVRVARAMSVEVEWLGLDDNVVHSAC